jgi:hypothetical protein
MALERLSMKRAIRGADIVVTQMTVIQDALGE